MLSPLDEFEFYGVFPTIPLCSTTPALFAYDYIANLKGFAAFSTTMN
jgi:hypothetical protein